MSGHGVVMEWSWSGSSDISKYMAFRDTHSNTIRLIWTFSVHYIHLRITKLAKSILFAEDFTMYNSSPDIHIINRHWPIEGPDWFRTNNLSLNVSKINCVMFCLKNNSKIQGGGVPSNTMKIKLYKRLMIGLYMDHKHDHFHISYQMIMHLMQWYDH